MNPDNKPNPENVENISVDELNKAEKEIVKYLQKNEFKEEIVALKKHKQVKRVSSLYKLDPFLNAEGIICVGGRLRNAQIPFETRHQMILPKNNHVVDLIVRFYHVTSEHSGKEYVLSLVREKFWIVQPRSVIRKILRGCFCCKRNKAKPAYQKMANLPEDRVEQNKPPFTYVGVDYFGPFMVKRARSLVKRYGCIFTCLTIRAVHIEIAHTLETDSFINALQRFISRRGCPETIRSDNGTNFVGAQREITSALKEWDNEKISKFLLHRNISWKFNPPTASHMGGIWERQIRTIRKILGVLLKEQTLDDEGLSTLMCQIEAIINNRPLTRLSDDPRDMEPLTPNHLLLLRSGPTLPVGVFTEGDSFSRRRWRHIQYLANLFWTRWVKEYLPLLQKRQKWMFPQRNFAINDLVLVTNENTPRNLWPLGRVIEVFPGKDGFVRSVRVKTMTSSLIRPVGKLCLLESIENLETL